MSPSGVGYLLGGLLGIGVNLLVAITLFRNKEISRSTRLFMAHLALSDAECFLGGAVYPSIIMITKPESEYEILVRIFSFFHDSGWHMSITFMALLAFSRLTYFSKQNLENKIFGGIRLLAFIIGSWLLVHAAISPLLFNGQVALAHDPHSGNRDFWWDFNTTLANGLMQFQAVHTGIALVIQVLCNAGTIYFIVKMRKLIMVAEVKWNFRREVKLFIQCAIDTGIFVFMYLGVNVGHHLDVQSTQYWSFFDAMWFLNHSDCALLYLAFNPGLTKALFGWFARLFKMNQNSVQPFPTV